MGYGSGIAVSCSVGCRRGSGRPVATAPIRPLAWEPPYAVGAAPKMAKKTKKKKRGKKKIFPMLLKQRGWPQIVSY